MRLVIFTGDYPFGKAETFLEEEMRIAEQHFDRIIIVTRAKDTSEKARYVPANAEVILARGNMNFIGRVLRIIRCVFSVHMWHELLAAKRTTDYKVREIIKEILLNENATSYVISCENEWLTPNEKVIYYSYWLNTTFSFKNVARMKGIKISRAHGGDCFFSRGYHPYRKEALRNLDLIFPISEAGGKDIIEHNKNEVPGLKKKVKVARLGINIPDLLNPFLDKKVKTIVTCSNMIQLKRLDLTVDALSEISDLEIHWIHFGEGELREKIQRYAEEKLGGKKNISYEFRGYTPNTEIMDFYKSNSVDLFVNCSDVEGIPVSVMEAMAHGIPAIGRNVGGMQELLDCSCGMLLPEKIEAHDLALAISEILELPTETYTAMRRDARSKIEKYYDAEKNYREFFETIKGCLNANE